MWEAQRKSVWLTQTPVAAPNATVLPVCLSDLPCARIRADIKQSRIQFVCQIFRVPGSEQIESCGELARIDLTQEPLTKFPTGFGVLSVTFRFQTEALCCPEHGP